MCQFHDGNKNVAVSKEPEDYMKKSWGLPAEAGRLPDVAMG
jgi:hypothetical protein